ncbi:MAG: signal peptidase II [Gemmatimonadaceae bacterium]|nr:signal peptidase II [Gemmatimonadaceae bacterium]
MTASSSDRAPLGRFWLIVAVVVAIDFATKWLVVQRLAHHVPVRVFGDVARLFLTYNPGAAFGMNVGDASRWVFGALSTVITIALVRWYRQTPPEARLVRLALPIVVGGALGNLLDRIRLREGVVDFIDIGIGTTRFWTFNVADSAVTIGAILLILALWRQEDEASHRPASA